MTDYAGLEKRLRADAERHDTSAKFSSHSGHAEHKAKQAETCREAADAIASLTKQLEQAPNRLQIANYLAQLNARIHAVFDREGRDALLQGLMSPADFSQEYLLSKTVSNENIV